MTREDAKRFLPIIKAYAEGKTIQESPAGKEDWADIQDFVSVNMRLYDYRVKPHPKYRPFKDAGECWQEMQKHRPFGWVKMDDEYCYIDKVYPDIVNISDIDNYELCEAYEMVTFPDGTPFGIRVEENPDD